MKGNSKIHSVKVNGDSNIQSVKVKTKNKVHSIKAKGNSKLLRQSDGEQQNPFRQSDGEQQYPFRQSDGEQQNPFRQSDGEQNQFRQSEEEQLHSQACLRIFSGMVQLVVFDRKARRNTDAGSRDFFPQSAFSADSLTVSAQPPCATACINICEHVKNPKHLCAR